MHIKQLKTKTNTVLLIEAPLMRKIFVSGKMPVNRSLSVEFRQSVKLNYYEFLPVYLPVNLSLQKAKQIEAEIFFYIRLLCHEIL